MSWRPWGRKSSPPECSTGADWVSRMRSGTIGSRERAQLREWLGRSPDNARDLLRAEATWRLSGALISDEIVQRELEELDRMTGARWTEHTASASKRTQSWLAGGWRAAAGMVAVACMAALALWLHFNIADVYETARGEQRVVTLADGSVVALNTNTQLRVAFSSNRRDIYLRHGEALFQVAHDPQRPFTVHAGSGYARAIGTRFNVLAARDRITVSVLEGRVEVSPDAPAKSVATRGRDEERERSASSTKAGSTSAPTLAGSAIGSATTAGQPALLQAGESAAYGPSGELLTPQPLQASTERIAAWREGKLRFDNWRLAEAIDEYNRYASKPIHLAAPQLADVRITGVFRIGDSGAFVTALGELVGATVEDAGATLELKVP